MKSLGFIDPSNFTYSFNEKDLREDDTLKNCLNEEKFLAFLNLNVIHSE